MSHVRFAIMWQWQVIGYYFLKVTACIGFTVWRLSCIINIRYSFSITFGTMINFMWSHMTQYIRVELWIFKKKAYEIFNGQENSPVIGFRNCVILSTGSREPMQILWISSLWTTCVLYKDHWICEQDLATSKIFLVNRKTGNFAAPLVEVAASFAIKLCFCM